MKKILLFLTLFCVTTFYGQKTAYKISGTIISEKEKTPIESATIYLEKVKDSSVVSYTISDEKGSFLLEGKSFEKEVKLFISFIGYKAYSKKIIFNNKPINIGEINLKPEDNILNEVVVKSRAPITIKKDTLEFNVKSFKTKKDANVEDLLKKLPGVEVDEEGNITVNGKAVNKILVNGKPFFGNDPTITTKNLTKEIIEKVQITDTKTKSEAFTGEKGDNDNKTINLTIKKENNKGWFGRVAAGGGTDDKYEAATIVNRFNNDRRISVLAGGNNINSPGFSFGEIQKMFGGGGGISFNSNGAFSVGGKNFGSGRGIVKSKNIGATYADEYSKGINVNANYFHSGSNSENASSRNRENILPDSRYFSNSNSNNTADNDNHNIEAELDIEIDSTFLINISPSFTFNNRENSSSKSEETLNENREKTNSSISNNSGNSKAKNFKNNIDVTKRFGSDGSFVKMSITNQINKTNGEDFNTSTTEIFGDNPSTENRNQFIDKQLDYTSLSTNVKYRQPIIAKTFFADFSYNYRTNERENIQSNYNFNDNTAQYSDFNSELSTNFIYNDTRKTPAIKLSYEKEKWSLSFKTGYVFRTLESEDKIRPELNLKKNFEALELNARFRKRFNSKASIYSGYSLRNSPPQLNQLQAFENISNPLNIITGNPNLKPSNNHRLYGGFHKFNWQKGTGFYSYASINISENQVISKSTVDDDFVRKTTYDNVNGNYSINVNATYSKKIKLDTVTNLKIRLGTNFESRKNINFFNDQKYSAKTNTFSPNIQLTLEWKDVLRISPRYTLNLSKTNFDVNTFDNQSYTQHKLRIRTKTTVPKKLEWRNDVIFEYNPDIVGDFQKKSWLWNSTLSYSVFKDKGTLSLKAYDLLNQNTNAKRSATENYIEDSQSTVLQRYFMLGFSWKFNSLGKKGKIREFNFDF